jgi:hypothetical protein
MKRNEDPYEGQPIYGEIPGPDNFLDQPVADYFENASDIKSSLLPDTHEVATDFEGEEVAADKLIVRLGKKSKEYTVHAIQGVGEHKKEVALGTMTLVGVMLAVKKMRPRKKK